MSYIVTTEFELNKIAAPNLPLPTPEYNRQYFDQLTNVLRLYFTELSNTLNTNATNIASNSVLTWLNS